MDQGEIHRRANVIHSMALRISRGDWDFAQAQALAVLRNPGRCIARGTVTMALWRHRRKERWALAMPSEKSPLHPRVGPPEKSSADILSGIVRRCRLTTNERDTLSRLISESPVSAVRAYALRRKLRDVYLGVPAGRWQRDKRRKAEEAN